MDYLLEWTMVYMVCVYFTPDSKVLAEDATTNNHLTKKNSNPAKKYLHMSFKMQIPQNNYVPLNDCLDLKKGFCVTACSQVYNEIVLASTHTGMD